MTEHYSADAFQQLERHQVRVLNLLTPRIPSPSGLQAVHIDKLHSELMFLWTEDGMLQLDGEGIPQLTILHLASKLPAEDSLPHLKFAPFPSGAEPPPASALDAEADAGTGAISAAAQSAEPIAPAVRRLAHQWAEDAAPGWPQIEAICRRLRSDYELAPQQEGTTAERALLADSGDSHTSSDGSSTQVSDDDEVARFLLVTRRGPDYLFAASAAVLLRELGFRSRVASGFYARAENYDRMTGQTSVYQDDLHFWLEIETADGAWLTVDPSPGYQVLYARMPWWRTARQALLTGVGQLWSYRWSLSALVLAAVLIWRTHVAWLSFTARLVWRLLPRRDARRVILSTLRLLEFQQRIAGRPRQASITVASWLQQWEKPGEPASLRHYRQLCQWALYGGQRACPVSLQEVSQVADRVVAQCKLALPDRRNRVGLLAVEPRVPSGSAWETSSASHPDLYSATS